MKAYLDTAAQLRLQQRQAERDLHHILFSNRHLPEIVQIEDFQRDLDMKRSRMQVDLQSGVSKLKAHVRSVTDSVNEFVTQTNEEGPGPNYDFVLSEMRKTIESIEAELRDFKDESRKDYDRLAMEGKDLEVEIEHLSERFESWKSQPQVALPPTAPERIPRSKPAASPLQQEIMTIERQLVDLGGKNLGWEDADMAEFLKMQTKHKGKLTPAFLHDCRGVLPYFSEDEIRSQYEKYRTYLDLNEKKKGLVTKWKTEKEQAKAEKLMKVEENPPPRRAQSVQSNREVKQQLEDWKKRKAEQIALETQRKAQETAAKRRSQGVSREEIEQKKQQIAEYKERKLIADSQKQLIADYERRRNQLEITDTDKARIKQRENQLREQRSIQILTKKQKEEEKKQREMELQMRSKIAWSHVESKLEAETAASLKRKETKTRENRVDSFGGMVVRTTGRAIPAWRAGLYQ